MMDAITQAVVWVLGLKTLFDVVGSHGWVPRDKPYSRLFYPHGQLEYLVQLAERHRELLERISRTKALPAPTLAGDPVQHLLFVLGQYTYQSQAEMGYGRETPTWTHYYVNTMEASHDRASLGLMVTLLMQLVRLRGRQRLPDFVITPKGGNPILGHAFAEELHCPCLLHKSEKENSRVVGAADAQSRFLVNFEGSQSLLRTCGEKPEAKASGIVVDCNASGGSQILAAMREFNQLVTELRHPIEPVSEVFLLFRPDIQDEIDTMFAGSGFKVYRYFDMTEDIKDCVFKLKGQHQFRNSTMAQIEAIRRRLEDEKLLRV
jgi:hypothetical protein